MEYLFKLPQTSVNCTLSLLITMHTQSPYSGHIKTVQHSSLSFCESLREKLVSNKYLRSTPSCNNSLSWFSNFRFIWVVIHIPLPFALFYVLQNLMSYLNHLSFPILYISCPHPPGCSAPITLLSTSSFLLLYPVMLSLLHSSSLALLKSFEIHTL